MPTAKKAMIFNVPRAVSKRKAMERLSQSLVQTPETSEKNNEEKESEKKKRIVSRNRFVNLRARVARSDGWGSKVDKAR